MAIRSIPGEGRELELFYCNTFLDLFFSPYLLVGCGIYWNSFSFPPKAITIPTPLGWACIYWSRVVRKTRTRVTIEGLYLDPLSIHREIPTKEGLL